MPHLDARAEPKAFRVVKTLSWGSMSVYTSPEQEMVRKDRSHSNQKSTVPPDEASVLTETAESLEMPLYHYYHSHQ